MDSTPLGKLNLKKLAKHFSDEDAARELLERMRWPDGPSCPTCGKKETVYRMQRLASSTKPGRKGLLRCRKCNKQFTVTVGTVFEDSHIPITTWIQALYLLCGASKKGMSAHQLHRMLGITYKSAWFMAHRLRYAMTQEPLASKLTGTVEADETYIGGKRKNTPRGRAGKESHKTPVVALVERGGRLRAMPVERVTADNLDSVLREHVDASASVMTDSWIGYRNVGQNFASHEKVDHAQGEYVRGECHTNTLEGFFSLLKRGIVGSYHHVGKGHLHRYCDEFTFRYSARKATDAERMVLAVEGAEGKRLTYKQPAAASA
jgi:transposase-like protein